MAYDPQGALGGLFAPAYIAGNPESEAAVSQWNAANLKTPPVSDFPSGGSGTFGPSSNVTVAAPGLPPILPTQQYSPGLPVAGQQRFAAANPQYQGQDRAQMFQPQRDAIAMQLLQRGG